MVMQDRSYGLRFNREADLPRPAPPPAAQRGALPVIGPREGHARHQFRQAGFGTHEGPRHRPTRVNNFGNHASRLSRIELVFNVNYYWASEATQGLRTSTLLGFD